uniref:Uncharacterized protein n=1 Tax=Rhizophora mucronata TaxID=61149 RepID=A0A2P2L8X1_RHIMU
MHRRTVLLSAQTPAVALPIVINGIAIHIMSMAIPQSWHIKNPQNTSVSGQFLQFTASNSTPLLLFLQFVVIRVLKLTTLSLHRHSRLRFGRACNYGVKKGGWLDKMPSPFAAAATVDVNKRRSIEGSIVIFEANKPLRLSFLGGGTGGADAEGSCRVHSVQRNVAYGSACVAIVDVNVAAVGIFFLYKRRRLDSVFLTLCRTLEECHGRSG